MTRKGSKHVGVTVLAFIGIFLNSNNYWTDMNTNRNYHLYHIGSHDSSVGVVTTLQDGQCRVRIQAVTERLWDPPSFLHSYYQG